MLTKHLHLKVLLFLSILIIISSCEENGANPTKETSSVAPMNIDSSTSIPKHNRLLGIGVNTGKNSFEKAMKVARSSGLQVIELPVQWDDIEKSPGNYDSGWLDIANSYYPSIGIKILVSFNPIDTNSLRIPADLKDKALDDPEVISRYNKAADYVLGRLKDADLVGFVIGNEIDGTLGDNDQQWAQYARFFKATSNHIRQQYPNIPIGTKVMFHSLIGANSAHAEKINTYADVIMSTYYPLDDSFLVKELPYISNDMDKLAALAGNKPIYLAEVGCPSSEHINSSMEKQSQFIHEIFKAWDKHHERIQLINFIWLHDISKAEVKSYTKYYGVSSTEFAEFLGTLGLRTYRGDAKPAFQALQNEAKQRGW